METKEQAEILCGLGGAMMQGYYFSKPMPADAVPGFLADAARPRPICKAIAVAA
jgi:EAL domain-containing protein (putative c-di-GMP-specific phosphodiesterase class I)